MRHAKGFTIIELLIVIVVIGILAAITTVAFSGIQQRGRDAQRKSDVVAITKALELYYLDNGQYPLGSGSTAINASWSTTADASWVNLKNQLVPTYMSSLPSDPTNTQGVFVASSTNNYSYAYFGGGTYCGVSTTSRQMYIFVYRLESGAQQDTLQGACTTAPILGPYSASNYRVVK
ncbi:MAG: Type secretion system protein [Candidatus Saccharibacteria bacterium]|nr:Type secretion system protein [Candidatus Saccharibacteria bacterium]